MSNSGRNSAWKILYDPRFASDLESLGRPVQLRIRKYLDKLARDCADPRDRGEPLRANLAGFWKYRVGDYRLLCQITDGNVVLLSLLAVTHR
ncbi:MAG TPA: type II toxin-antitoxin system RelE/ParE family toxin, partial [Candidatus Acidoferrum sp.]|nr:type II toxin-antitoxin system RelE/ParE family toxin [Candidatus Acidoferrum sp.]